MDWDRFDRLAAVRDGASDVYQAANSIKPPDFVPDEDPTAYRIRILQGLQHASLYRNVDLTALNPAKLDRVERQICAEAMACAKVAPTLSEIHKVDARGREFSEFVGSKSSWMNAYKSLPLLMVGVSGQPVRLQHLP